MIESSDIARVLEPYVRVYRASEARISVYCPFHPVDAPGTEKHPSMSIYVHSGRVLCFTCGYRGWLDTFLIARGMDQPGARAYAQALKSMRGPRAPTDDAAFEERTGALASWAGSFQAYLPRNLLDAGFRRSTLERFGVGYDTRYRRVTYPIYDRHGGLVAIVGGAVDQETFPKYKLYEEEVGIAPGTEQRHRDHLWGFHLLPPTGEYGIVEGYKACMWVHQCGFPVVCTQGVGFTPTQVELIATTYRPVWILYDNDTAGTSARSRLHLKLLQTMGPLVRTLTYGSEDPALQPDKLSEQQMAEIISRKENR